MTREDRQLKTITLDTNVLPADDLIELARSMGWDVVVVSVTERELGYGDRRLQVAGLGKVLELGIIGESEVGNCVVGGGDDYMESIIQIISNGSFPKSGSRGQLSNGQRRQLRDAMILDAHAREGRSVFVTNDMRGFIDGGRREMLQALLKTKILSGKEFFQGARS